MKNSNLKYDSLENLSNSERVVRVLVSTAAIVVAMESTITGSSMFAVLSFLVIALAMTGIIGWDPVRAMFDKSAIKYQVLPHNVDSKGHYV